MWKRRKCRYLLVGLIAAVTLLGLMRTAWLLRQLPATRETHLYGDRVYIEESSRTYRFLSPNQFHFGSSYEIGCGATRTVRRDYTVLGLFEIVDSWDSWMEPAPSPSGPRP